MFQLFQPVLESPYTIHIFSIDLACSHCGIFEVDEHPWLAYGFEIFQRYLKFFFTILANLCKKQHHKNVTLLPDDLIILLL